MLTAIRLYNDFLDMDFMDYIEDFEEDIAFIASLVAEMGEEGARAYLTQYFDA